MEEKMKIDLDYIRKITSEYTTEELVEYILVKSNELVPEALSIVKEEYRKREGDINNLIKNANSISGEIEYIIEETRIYSYKSNRVTQEFILGNLHLTSKGIYFIPQKAQKDFGYSLGLFGLLGVGLSFIAGKLSEEKLSNNKNLPLSLLTKYIEDSFLIKIENIKAIKYWESGRIYIKEEDTNGEAFNIVKDKIPLLKSWATLHNLSFILYKGFFEKLFARKGNKWYDYYGRPGGDW